MRDVDRQHGDRLAPSQAEHAPTAMIRRIGGVAVCVVLSGVASIANSIPAFGGSASCSAASCSSGQYRARRPKVAECDALTYLHAG